MRKIWTQEEQQKLSELYPDMYTQEVADLMNRSKQSIYAMAYNMGLKKSASFIRMELEKQGEKLKIAGKDHRFHPGVSPPNKGKKMPPKVYEKCKRTFFTKGNLPHNTKYDGHERLSKEGYIEIRVAVGQYRLKHHIVWEEAFGEIPKDSVIRFKDGNKLNCTPENLYSISKIENMIRNSIHCPPEELIRPMVLRNQIKKAITKKTSN